MKMLQLIPPLEYAISRPRCSDMVQEYRATRVRLSHLRLYYYPMLPPRYIVSQSTAQIDSRLCSQASSGTSDEQKRRIPKLICTHIS